MIEYKVQGGNQLHTTYMVQTPFRPDEEVTEADGYCFLHPDGMLVIRKGYVWDGPSTGPFSKFSSTKTFMRPSLVLDALHQLMRQNTWFRSYKDEVDDLLKTHCLEDGMSSIRAWWVRKGVSQGVVTEPRPVVTAP